MKVDLEPAAQNAIVQYLHARNDFRRRAFLAHMEGKLYESEGARKYAERLERAVAAEQTNPDTPGLAKR